MEYTAGADRGVHWVDRHHLGSLVGLYRFIVDAASVLVNIVRKVKIDGGEITLHWTSLRAVKRVCPHSSHGS